MLTDPFTGEPSLAFTMFAAEAEGDIPTEQGKYNKVIRNLRKRASYKIVDENDVYELAGAANLFLSQEEVQDILNEVMYE